MRYSEVRDYIKSGDILVWEIKRIGSITDALLYVYQKIYKTKHSHVGIAVKIGGRLFCLEATPPVVRLIPISMLPDFSWLKNGINWKENYYDTIFKHIGKPYSLIDYLKNLCSIETSSDDFYCSEFVANCLKDLGVIEDESVGINPMVLVNYLEEKLDTKLVNVSVDRGNL